MTLTRVVRLFAVVLAVSLAATGCVRTKVLHVALHTQAFPTEPKIDAVSQSTVADIQATSTPDHPLGAPHVAGVTTTIVLKEAASATTRDFLEKLPDVNVTFDDAGRTVRLFYSETVQEVAGEPNTFKYTLRSPLPFLTIPKGSEKSGVVVLPAPTLVDKAESVQIVSVGDEGDSKVTQGVKGQRTTVTWYARETDPWQIIYRIIGS